MRERTLIGRIIDLQIFPAPSSGRVPASKSCARDSDPSPARLAAMWPVNLSRSITKATSSR